MPAECKSLLRLNQAGYINPMARFMAASKVLGEETVSGNGAAASQSTAGK